MNQDILFEILPCSYANSEVAKMVINLTLLDIKNLEELSNIARKDIYQRFQCTREKVSEYKKVTTSNVVGITVCSSCGHPLHSIKKGIIGRILSGSVTSGSFCHNEKCVYYLKLLPTKNIAKLSNVVFIPEIQLATENYLKEHPEYCRKSTENDIDILNSADVKYKPTNQQLDKYSYKKAVSWNNKGMAFVNNGQNEKALMAFDKALEFANEAYPAAWNNKGVTLMRANRFEEALKAYDIATKLEDDNASMWHNKGQVFYYLKRYQEAIEAFNKAISLDLKDDIVWFEKGKALYHLERMEEALEAFTQAVTINKNNADYWHNKGAICNILGRKREAEEAFAQEQLIRTTNVK